MTSKEKFNKITYMVTTCMLIAMFVLNTFILHNFSEAFIDAIVLWIWLVLYALLTRKK